MEIISEVVETKDKKLDSINIDGSNSTLKNLNKELTSFLSRHTVYETVPENTKVKVFSVIISKI